MEEIKSILIQGQPARFAGKSDDLYFQHLNDYEAQIQRFSAFLDKNVARDSTVLDIGANLGLMTVALARHARQVIAYEPSPVNLVLLRKNLELNRIENVEVVAAAASSEAATLRFHEAQYGAGSHVVPAGHLAGDRVPTCDVPALTLDSQVLPPISFIKMDTEGHEPNVLAGARKLLERDRPLIYMEINIWCLSAFAGHSPGALVRMLWERFEVGGIELNGDLIPLVDAYMFLHQIIVQHQGMADLVLRPRVGAVMPTLPELAWPPAAVELLKSLPGIT